MKPMTQCRCHLRWRIGPDRPKPATRAGSVAVSRLNSRFGPDQSEGRPRIGERNIDDLTNVRLYLTFNPSIHLFSLYVGFDKKPQGYLPICRVPQVCANHYSRVL